MADVKLTVLDVYGKIGYLNYGNKRYTADDRIRVGKRLHDDYYMATHGIQAIDYAKERVDVSVTNHESDKVLEAKEKFARAMKSMPLEFRRIVFRVCCEDKRIAEEKLTTAWKRRVYLITQAQLLSLGLDRLVKYYLKSKKIHKHQKRA